MQTPLGRIVFAACLAVAFSPAARGSVQVSFQAVRPIQGRCEISALTLHLGDGTRRELKLGPPVTVSAELLVREVDLPPSTTAVAATADGCWIDTVSVDSAKPVALRAWPLSTLEVSFDQKPKVRDLVVDAAFVDSDAKDGSRIQRVRCALVDSGVRCGIPALRPLHVKLSIDGFAPLFLKNVASREAQLVGGGSWTLGAAYVVEGRVVSHDGRPLAGAHVRLLTAAAGEMAPGERLLRNDSAVTDAQGYYRFNSVVSASYRVVSHVPALSDVVVDPLVVHDRNLRVEPMVHRSRGVVETLLSPPVAPNGDLWSVTLMRRGTRQGEVVDVQRGTTNAAGLWRSEPLDNGEYTIIVRDPSRSEVARRDVVLDGRDEYVQITVAGIVVRGRLLAGDAGRSGELAFRDRSGRKVTATAADDGAFRAVFPSAGVWRVTVTTVPARTILELEDIAVSSEGSDAIEVRLPGGRITGVMVDRHGRPIQGVAIATRDHVVLAQSRSNEAGEFTLEHLREEPHQVKARGATTFSQPADADLSRDNSIEMKLVLEPKPVATGFVVSAGGQRMSGAVVRIIDVITGVFEDTIADVEGRYSVDLKTSGTIDIIVMAPPAPIIVRRLTAAQWRDQSPTLVVPAVGATLRVALQRVPPWPTLTGADGLARSLGLFVMPDFGASRMREFVDGAFQFVVEAGAYRVCYREDCREAVVGPGARSEILNFIKLPELP